MCPSYRATGEEHALHPRPGPAAVRDGGRRGGHRRLATRRRSPRRWTCACPARAASATARSGWTWPPTRRSSWPSATARRLRPRVALLDGRAAALAAAWSAGSRRARSTPSTPPPAARWPRLAKRLGGIAPERAIPPLARRPFTACPACQAPPSVARRRTVAFRRRRRPRRAAGAALAGHLHQPLRPARSPPTPSRCWSALGLHRRAAAARPSAAG